MASKTGNKSLAVIYANALYEAAKDGGTVEQVGGELKMLRVLTTRAPKLERLLVSPTVSFEEKRKVIEGAFGSFSQITRNFLLVLIDRKRAQLLGTIADLFTEIVNQKSGIAAVEVHTARQLEAGERDELKALLQKKLGRDINLTEKVRPELLGGMVLQHEDKMWDASVAHYLREAVEKMEELKLAAVKWSD